MNPNTVTISAGLAAMLALPLQAIEPPKDESLPPAVRERMSRQAPQPSAAYLGIVSGDIPEVLAAHLGTTSGVLVTGVMPDGPAATAGLEKHDIITHIDKRPVSQPADLTHIVRSKKPGDTLEIEALHQGKARVMQVTLTERSIESQPLVERNPLRRFNMDGVPESFEKRIRDMIEGNLRSFDIQGLHDMPFEMDPPIGNMMRDLRERMQRPFLRPDDSAPPTPDDNAAMEFQHNTSIRILDQDGSIEIHSNNGIRTLTVRDTDNQPVWSGPWNTDEDKSAAPEEIRKRVERLNLESSLDGNNFKLQINPVR